MAIEYTSDKQRFAKECLYIALLRLMKRKSFNDIKVTELASEAGVSRMAFYRNYLSVVDILKEHLEYELFGGDLTVDDVKSIGVDRQLELFFDYLRQSSELIYCLINSDLSYLLLDSSQRMVKRFGIIIGGERELDKYEISATKGIVYMVVVDWAKEGMLESSADMGALLFELLKKLQR